MKKYILIFTIFLLVTLIVTYPLIFNLSTYVFGKGDELLITWILNWNIHAIITNPLQIFNTNIFYPYINTLSFSDTLFTSSFIALIPSVIFKEPLIAYNINVIISFTLLSFFTFLLVKYLTNNVYASFISGLLISFSPFTLGRVFQIQVISIQWIPLSILFFLQFLQKGNIKYIIATSIFFLIQIANSFQPGFFLLFSYVIIILYLYISNKKILLKRISKQLIIVTGITIILTLLLSLPYFNTSRTFNYTRNIRDTIHFANRPEYTFYPNNKTKLQQLLLHTIYKNDKGPYTYDGYWGLPIIILFIVSIIGLLKTNNQKRKYGHIFLFIAFCSFILSLGPALQWGGKVIKWPLPIPLPYALFYYLIPGFNGFRNSSRWEMLTILSISIFIGIIISIYLKKQKPLCSFFIILLISCSILFEIQIPFQYVKMPTSNNFPYSEKFIQQLPKNSIIIHFPIYSWDMLPYSYIEFEREYYSTLHFKKMINGFSGFSPHNWENNAKLLTSEFPNAKTVSNLKQLQVQYIIIHKKEYDKLYKNTFMINNHPIQSFETLEKNINQFHELKFISKFKDDYIYSLK